MASPDYTAYSPTITFVDDVAGSGGTALDAAHINGLRSDLVTYVQNHINGIANHHDTADTRDGSLSEALAYANVVATFYDGHSRNDMWASLFKSILGGTGNLTTRVAAFLGNSGSDINSLFTALGIPTNTATIDAVVKRDHTGGAQFTAVGVIPPASASSIGVNVAAPSSYTGAPYAYSKSGGGSMAVNNDATVTAPGFIGPLTGLASTATNAGHASVADALAAPTPFTSTISDYKATPGTAGVVNIAAGGPYRDINGTKVAGGAATTINMPTQPTGAHTQYVAITKAPVTGALTRTDGVIDDPESALVIPLVNEPVATVLLRGATTNPGYVLITSDISDLRGRGYGGGGSGSGGGISTADAVWTYGDFTATVPNAKDSSSVSATGYMQPGNVRKGTAATNASFADVQNVWVPPDIAARLSKSAANTITLTATALSPVPFRDYRAVASSSATASGTSGPRYAIFDTATGGLVTPMPSTLSLAATQGYLATYWWDNANNILRDDIVDLTPLMSALSTQVGRVTVPLTDGGATSASLPTAAGYGPVPTMAPVTFYVAVACHLTWTAQYWYTYAPAGVAPSFGMRMALDSGAYGQHINTVAGTFANTFGEVDPVFLAPGLHTLGLNYANVAGAGSTVQFIGTGNKLTATIWR